MIDCIKVMRLPVNTDEIENNPLLDFPIYISGKNQGEILERNRTAIYNGLVFTITPNEVCKLNGSLHKYHNSGSDNLNDFFYSDLVDVVIDLWRKFGINPKRANLNFIEFGVNIRLPHHPGELLENLIQYKGIPFSRDVENGKEFYKCNLQQYAIKIYNKGLQYGKNENNILRFELKVYKMEYLKNTGIVTLWDILNDCVLIELGRMLAESFQNIVLWDGSINTDEVPEDDRKLLEQGNNPRYWTQLKTKQRRTYYNRLAKFNELVCRYGTNNLRKIEKLITDKWEYLFKRDLGVLHKLTVFESELMRLGKTAIPFNSMGEIISIAQNNISNKMLNSAITSTVAPRYCPVTGLDISMQKTGSKFLSRSGVSWYFLNDPGIFAKLEKRLTDGWKNKPLKTQFGEIAHSVRNEYFNPKNNTRRRIMYLISANTLFNNFDLIRPEKLRIAGMLL